MALTKVSSGLISADASSVDLNIDAGTLYIDATNNRVGIGTTSPTGKLEIAATGTNAAPHIKLVESGDTREFNIYNDGSGNGRLVLADTDDTPDTEIVLADNGIIQFKTANTERATIDSSGNVGIGTSSPSSYYSKSLVVSAGNEDGITIVAANGATTYANYLMFADGTTGNEAYRGWLGYDHLSDSLNIASHGFLRIYSGSTTQECLRIDSSGVVLVGKTAENFGSDGCQMAQDGTFNTTVNKATNSGENAVINRETGYGTHISFRFNNNEKGNIYTNGSNVAYNTSSDARLKDVIGEARGLEVINALNPVSYNWKESGKSDEGLIAQEVQEIVPNAVTQGEDGYYSMDYSKLVTHLVAGMKEQQVLIEELKTRIETLENS